MPKQGCEEAVAETTCLKAEPRLEASTEHRSTNEHFNLLTIFDIRLDTIYFRIYFRISFFSPIYLVLSAVMLSTGFILFYQLDQEF